MRLLYSDNLGAPLAMIRVHPFRKRLVGLTASRDEAFLWGWEAGRLQRLAQLGATRDYKSTRRFRVGSRALEFRKEDLGRDVAFHPDGVHIATVGEGRPIEFYRVSDGEPMHTIGDISGPVDSMASNQPVKIPLGITPVDRGFERISFSDSGRLVIAQSIGAPGAEVYSFGTGALVGSLWEGFYPYATHPKEELLAMVLNDQGGTLIRFARVRVPFQRDEGEIGWGRPRIRVSDEEDECGWYVPSMVNVCCMVFSPAGDAFAVSGGAFGCDDLPMSLAFTTFHRCAQGLGGTSG
jgi:hypothetical protein